MAGATPRALPFTFWGRPPAPPAGRTLPARLPALPRLPLGASRVTSRESCVSRVHGEVLPVGYLERPHLLSGHVLCLLVSSPAFVRQSVRILRKIPAGPRDWMPWKFGRSLRTVFLWRRFPSPRASPRRRLFRGCIRGKPVADGAIHEPPVCRE